MARRLIGCALVVVAGCLLDNPDWRPIFGVDGVDSTGSHETAATTEGVETAATTESESSSNDSAATTGRQGGTTWISTTGFESSDGATTGEPPSCAALFEDDFEGSQLNPAWEVQEIIPIDVGNGDARFHVGVQGEGFTGIASPIYNAAGVSMVAEVSAAPEQPYSQFFMAFDLIDTADLVALYVEQGQVAVRHWTTPSQFTMLASGTWSPDDRFVRMREVAGQVVFEKSTDGIAFSEVYVYSLDIRDWMVYLELLGGSYDSNPGDETIAVASFYSCKEP